MKYFYSVLVSTIIFVVIFIFCYFPDERKMVYLKCEEAAKNKTEVVEKEPSLNNLGELLQVKKVITSYLDGSAIEVFEIETIEFLQRILNDIEKKIKILKD